MKTKYNRKHLVVLVFLCMAIFGFVENIKGTLIPSIRTQFGVDYSAIGTMILISSFGYLLATLIGGLVADKWGKKPILMFGFLTLIVALVLFYITNTFAMTVILLLLISTGFGAFEVAVNSLGAQIFIRNTAVMMNLTHLFYGLGSSISPKYAGHMLTRNIPWNYIYTTTLALLIPALIYLAFLRFPESPKEADHEKLPVKKMIRDKRIWLIIGTLGFSLVAEIGVANWLVNFLQEARGMTVERSSLYMTLFFATFMLGRLVGGHIAERIGYTKIILYFSLASVVFFSGGMFLNNWFAFLFSCTGFFVSILFPTMMSLIMKEFPVGTSSVMGLVIAAAGGINMVLNWVIGKANDLFSVNLGFFTIAIFTILIAVFVLPLGKSLTYDKNLVDGTSLGEDPPFRA